MRGERREQPVAARLRGDDIARGKQGFPIAINDGPGQGVAQGDLVGRERDKGERMEGRGRRLRWGIDHRGRGRAAGALAFVR